MRQYSKREFVKIVKNNGYSYVRSSGSHDIYYNKEGKHISIPRTPANVIVRRLIRENNLIEQ